MKQHLKHGRAALVLGLVGLGSVAASATPAHAAGLSLLPVGKVAPAPAPVSTSGPKLPFGGATGCTPAATSQPFSQWGDQNQYKLVAGSSFSSATAGWTLSGGAHLVSGGEPFGATGSVSESSLALPPGASAQSPYDCVDPSNPTWRFFLQNATSSSTLQVAVVYNAPFLGTPISMPVGTMTSRSGWQPSEIQMTNAQLQSLLHGGTADLSLRFTSVSGTTNIDDVFIDPRMRG